jgi:hypothetical protein
MLEEVWTGSQRLSVVEELRVQKTMVIMMLSNTHEIIGTVSEALSDD